MCKHIKNIRFYSHIDINRCQPMSTDDITEVASDICMVDSSTVRLLDLVSSHRRSVLGLFKTVTSQVCHDINR